jgi:tetratricopeptide (TPR) repeat protein
MVSELAARRPVNLPRDLDRLETSQLIRGLFETEPIYTFKHNLVQQVAYQSMLAPDRRSLHRDVGETLERIYDDRRHEMAETLAGHFDLAGDSRKALDYTTLAAEQALRRFATAEAAGLFAKAIELAGQAEFNEPRLLLLYQQRGRALELRGDYSTALALYEELEALGRERAAPGLELAGVIGATSLQAVPTPLFDLVAALANAERALALAQAADDPAGQAKAYWLQMLVQTRIDAKAAVAAGNASLELARKHGLREQEAFTLNDIQANYQVLGQPDRALQALEEARPIWRSLENLPMLADNLASTAMLHSWHAEYDLGVDRARESLAISDRTGNLWGQSHGRIAIGLSYFARGELGPAIQEIARCIELSEQAGFVFPQIAMRSLLAIAYGQGGDLKTAEELALRVRQVEEVSPLPGLASGASTQAWIAVQQGDFDQARHLLEGVNQEIAHLADALLDIRVPLAMAEPAYYLARKDFAGALQSAEAFSSTFERYAMRIIRGPLLMARGRALVGLGRAAEALVAFDTARSEMVGQGFDAGLWEVEAELAGLAKAEGDSAESARLLRSAAEHIEVIAAGLREIGLEESFLAQPRIRSIREQAAGAPSP